MKTYYSSCPISEIEISTLRFGVIETISYRVRADRNIWDGIYDKFPGRINELNMIAPERFQRRLNYQWKSSGGYNSFNDYSFSSSGSCYNFGNAGSSGNTGHGRSSGGYSSVFKKEHDQGLQVKIDNILTRHDSSKDDTACAKDFTDLLRAVLNEDKTFSLKKEQCAKIFDGIPSSIYTKVKHKIYLLYHTDKNAQQIDDNMKAINGAIADCKHSKKASPVALH